MGGGCWQEFLVLEKLSDQEILLDIRIWECLGEIGELGFEEEEDGETHGDGAGHRTGGANRVKTTPKPQRRVGWGALTPRSDQR